MGRYEPPVKSDTFLTVSPEQSRDALQKLRDAIKHFDGSSAELAQRLVWFRDYKAYKVFGHSTFTAFAKVELGRSRSWVFEHIKTLPVLKQIESLTPKKSAQACIDPDYSAKNATDGKMGDFEHKHLLELSKLNQFERAKVIPVLLEKPPADLAETKAVIAEALGRTQTFAGKAVSRPAIESAGVPVLFAVRDTLNAVARECGRLATLPTDELVTARSTVSGMAQQLRLAAKKLSDQ